MNPTLTSGRVVLGPPIPADLGMRLRYGRHAEIARMYGAAAPESTELSGDDAERWYRRVAGDPLAWIIDTDGICAGVVRLHSLVERDRRARLAIGLLHPDLLGRGTGTSAIRILLRHAFDTLQLHRVDLRVLLFKVRAIRCYEKYGFVREGIELERALVHLSASRPRVGPRVGAPDRKFRIRLS